MTAGDGRDTRDLLHRPPPEAESEPLGRAALLEVEAENTLVVDDLLLLVIGRVHRAGAAAAAPGALGDAEPEERELAQEAVKSPERAEVSAPEAPSEDREEEEQASEGDARGGKGKDPYDPDIRVEELEDGQREEHRRQGGPEDEPRGRGGREDPPEGLPPPGKGVAFPNGRKEEIGEVDEGTQGADPPAEIPPDGERQEDNPGHREHQPQLEAEVSEKDQKIEPQEGVLGGVERIERPRENVDEQTEEEPL